jgi:stress response protein SCP2
MNWISSVTLDVSAIICDADGDKVDAVYYKNKKSSSGAVNL